MKTIRNTEYVELTEAKKENITLKEVIRELRKTNEMLKEKLAKKEEEKKHIPKNKKGRK